jgi:cyclophilin family peptidyl-prolyl cis-trans isomerase
MKDTLRLFLIAVLVPLAALLTASACFAADPVRVRMETNRGDIVLELDPERAPKTVENFLRYADEGFYDGLIFHRVISGFMIQGGGFTSDFARKSTHDPIPNEADNGLDNDRGTIAMARTAAPDSATAQFFINLADNQFLNHTEKSQRGWGYTVFGRVVEGLEVVDDIAALPTGSGGQFRKDVPRETVVIERVSRQ